MKRISFVLKPFAVDKLTSDLSRGGIADVLITETKEFRSGADEGRELYRGAEYVVEYLPGVKVEIFVHDLECQSVLKWIISSHPQFTMDAIWIESVEAVFAI